MSIKQLDIVNKSITFLTQKKRYKCTKNLKKITTIIMTNVP